MSNLLEYALVGEPLLGSPASLLTPSIAGNDLTLNFNRDTTSTDVTIRVQTSTDLMPPWVDVAVSVNGAAFTSSPGFTVLETGAGSLKSVKVTAPVASAARFFRIKAEQ